MASDRICPSCGTSNPFIFKKCQKCQAALGGVPAAVAAPAGTGAKVSLAPAGLRAAAGPSGAVAAAPAAKIGLGGSVVARSAAPQHSTLQAAVVTPSAAVPPTPSHNSASPPAFVAQVPVPTSPAPSAAAPQAGAAPGSRWRVRPWFAAPLAAAAGLALLACFLFWSPTLRDVRVRRSVVQVTTNEASGTGFFVEGPDDWAYVATAFHVVESGAPITIAREVEITPDKHYFEAYLEAEIAAYDADSDLAVIRLRNVKRSTFGALTLATRPLQGTRIWSYGFPGRTLMRRQALLTQEGNVLSLGRFPVIDSRTRTIVRDNGVEGILISSSLEPGYSGGPTCDEHGEVVGVNAIKDRTQMQHNGAIGVAALRRLIDRIKPLEKRLVPTLGEVQDLLGRIAEQYLRLPPEDRVTRREHEFIALTDLPKVHAFAAEVRRVERDTSPSVLGLAILAQTGSTLSTYHHEDFQQSLAACEKKARVNGFFEQLTGDVKVGDKDERLKAMMSPCDDLAVRPLTWDLTAITLRWDVDRSDHDLSVAKVESVDDDEPVYRASVALKTAPTTFDVWIRWEGPDLKLKLVDKDGAPYGLGGTRSTGAASLNGRWTHARARTPHPADTSVDLQWEETIEVSSGTADQVTVRHVLNAQIFTTAGHFECPRDRLDWTVAESFTGTLKPGGALLSKRTDSKVDPASFEGCKVNLDGYYAPSVAMVLKNRGDRLVVYRASGSEVPEEVEFSRR
jgi:S1-C subfamily serine protease